MRQRTFLPANGWLENFFSVAQIHMSKGQKDIGSAHKQLKIPPEALGEHKIGKTSYVRKPNNKEENFFACSWLVGELFSVAQIHMSKAQKGIRSAHKQLERPPSVLHGHKMGKIA